MKKFIVNLNGQTALVTGASGGIGNEIANRLLEAGANVAFHFQHNEPDIRSPGTGEAIGKAISIHADLNAPDCEKKIFDQICDQLDIPTILVNCAANQNVERLSDLSTVDFQQIMQTNVSAAFGLSREFANRLSRSEGNNAAIVNMSSIEANRPAHGHGHYAASKAAIETLTKSMALEFGHIGLRVNAIAPGLISRPGIENDWPQGVEQWQQACPLSRMGTPQDIVNAVIFLVSSAASFINGTTLTIDGGMSVVPAW